MSIDGDRRAAWASISIRFEDPAALLMRWIACALAGAVTAGAPAAVDPGATARVSELTAEQIVEKDVAARGGLEAWRKIQTMVWTGHMESAHAPVPVMQFVLEQKRPNKMRFEIDAMGKRSARAFDGAHGWKLRPGRDGKPDVKPYTRQEETYAFRAQSFDGPLIDYQAKGSTVVLEGIDEIEGHRAYRLSVQLASGETDRVWIDEQSYLEIRYDRPSYAPGAKPSTVSVFYRDYKPIEDLQIPMTIETAAAPGQSPDRLLIERVMMNAPLEERTFAAPGTAGRRRSGLSMNPLTGPPAPVAPAAPASAEPQVPPFASSPDPRSGSK